MRPPQRTLLAVSLLVCIATAGCARFAAPTQAELERGYILFLPGVAGTESSMIHLAEGLREAGIDRAIDFDVWGDKPFAELKNVRSLELNRKRAAERAAKVAAYQREYPGSPIHIVGFSGGGGIALFLCEALPAEVRVDRVILLAGAVSPEYDLAPALRHCRGGIVNIHSDRDWFDGGMLTRTFGTMDRKYSFTAGHVGFRDAAGGLLEMDGLTQIAWTPAWRALGHNGSHLGCNARAWSREILAPLLKEAP